jgi:hypothetical protein
MQSVEETAAVSGVHFPASVLFLPRVCTPPDHNERCDGLYRAAIHHLLIAKQSAARAGVEVMQHGLASYSFPWQGLLQFLFARVGHLGAIKVQ